MGDKTGIAWTDATWNPIRGCTPVSEGCRYCYAASVAARFSGPGMPYEGLAERTPKGPRWTGEVRLIEDHLDDPLHWRKPRRVFVNSMSDLFHPALWLQVIARIFAVMAAAPQHTFQVLTKRPERMAQLLNDSGFLSAVEEFAVIRLWPLPNVWLGTSVENQEAAGERIPHLLRTPAAVRFLSCEPLLGPIDLEGRLDTDHECPEGGPVCGQCFAGAPAARIHWVIVGGESGPNHRPFDPAWARSLRDQCREAGVAFFFKQVGGLRPTSGGDLLDGERIQEYPVTDREPDGCGMGDHPQAGVVLIPGKRQKMETCMDCDGKGYFVQAEDFTAHDCPSCQGSRVVPV